MADLAYVGRSAASNGISRLRAWWFSLPGFLWIVGFLVALALLLPVAYLLLRALGAGDAAWQELVSARTARILGRTLWLAFCVTLSCALMAVPLAWLTVRSDLPLRRMWAVLTPLPLVIPSYVGAYLMISVLGPRGLLQHWLEPLGVQRLPDIYGFRGAFLALTLLSYPYVLLSTRAALLRMNPAMEEASRNLGSGPWRTFWRVTLPQLRPGLVAGGLLVTICVLRDFGAVSLMRYSTFTRAIYLQYQSSFDRTMAAILALVLVLITLTILAIDMRTRGRASYYGGDVGSARPAVTISLGHWRWPSFFFCAAVVTLGLVMPGSVLVFWLMRGIRMGVDYSSLFGAALNSLMTSGVSAALALLAAIPVAVLSVRHAGRASGIMERISYSAFALPGMVVALALVFFGANFARPLYQTMAMLLLGYMILFLPEVVGVLRAALLQLSPSLEHAARTLGRGPLGVFTTITVPLTWSGIAAGAVLVFLTAMKELPVTLMLSPLGFRTLSTSVWSAVSEAFFAEAAAPSLLLILLSSLPMALLVIRERDRIA